MIISLSLIPPSSPLAVTLARFTPPATEAETRRMVKELNEAARKRRADEEAEHARRRREAEELSAETRRLSERGRARRAVAATAPLAATGSVFDLYRAREAARQERLTALNGGRR